MDSASTIHLKVTSLAEIDAVIHGSTNLEDWTPVATNDVHGEWTVMMPSSPEFQFFKVEAD